MWLVAIGDDKPSLSVIRKHVLLIVSLNLPITIVTTYSIVDIPTLSIGLFAI